MIDWQFRDRKCRAPLARFAPEFILETYMFARAVNDSVCFCCFFCIYMVQAFYFCFVKCFSERESIKLVIALFCFAFCMLFVNALCKIACLFSCLLPMLLRYVCILFACAHFYSIFTHQLVVILQNYTCLLLLVALQILGGVASARLICFSPMRLRFCCIWGLEQSSSRVQFSFHTSSSFFAASVVFFEHSFLSWKTTVCTNLREIVSFFLTLLFVFCLIFACTHLYYTARLFLPLDPSKRSSLITMTTPANFLCFFAACKRCKICPSHSITSLFVLFLLLTVTIDPIAPIQIDVNPYTSTRVTFWPLSQNMMPGEIYPAIGPKSGSARPLCPSLCFVFVLPMPPTPQRTHIRPYAPISIYFYPHTP